MNKKELCCAVKLALMDGILEIENEKLWTMIKAANVRENVHGYWIKICSAQSWQYTNEHFKCNKCDYVAELNTNFCPHCGADMRKGEKNVRKSD